MHIESKFGKTVQLMVLAACGTGLLMVTHYAAAATPASRSQHRAADATTQATGAVMGDFEGKAIQNERYGTLVPSHGSEMGWGWSSTDDQRVGGQSTASIALADTGADGTHGALKVSGELKAGFISPWAGAVWFPGAKPMQPADLSDKQALTFWARGKPGTYSIMLMAGSARSIPVYASFTLTNEWKQYHIPLSAFTGADLQHVYFIAFSAAQFGDFQFELDQVALHPGSAG